MIHVIVTNQVKPGKLEDFLALARQLAPLVEQEAGCFGYEYTLDTESPLAIQEPVETQRVTLLERWESLAALEAHATAPHMQEYGPGLRELRESVTIRVSRSLD